LRFLVDAQLPPSLAAALRAAGNDAFHVGDIDLLAAADRRIWQEAVTRAAVLVTKDRDFSLLRAARGQGPCVLWIRIGNCDNRTLIAQLMQALPAIVKAVERGEPVVEFVARSIHPR
jgi:predicted nuclease of predicted toxin-antitoxin system